MNSEGDSRSELLKQSLTCVAFSLMEPEFKVVYSFIILSINKSIPQINKTNLAMSQKKTLTNHLQI